MNLLITIIFFVSSTALAQTKVELEKRPRAREVGLEIGILQPGKWNAITDVEGVKVGQVTLCQGTDVRTGVTAILPHGGNLFQEKVSAAIYVGNGFGKLMGSTQVEELGNIETPILLTNTLNVPLVADAVLEYVLKQPGNEKVRSVNPVVGETNDGWLNNIQKRSIGKAEVFQAIETAQSGPVEEGSVGAGTGTLCFGFKGGIGTASRILPESQGGYTVGVLVQTNFGGILEINGAPVGRELGQFYLYQETPYQKDGSCMIVVATDAPLLSRNLKRLAKRALLGLAKTGSFCSNGSGDYVIAFSTRKIPEPSLDPQKKTYEVELLHNEYISPLFLAVVEATQEAVYNSLFKATRVEGWEGHVADPLPLDKVIKICEKYQVLKWNSQLPGLTKP